MAHQNNTASLHRCSLLLTMNATMQLCGSKPVVRAQGSRSAIGTGMQARQGCLPSARAAHVEKRSSRGSSLKLYAAQAEEASPSSSPASAAAPTPVPVPNNPEATIDQATQAMLRAYRDGIKRQRIQYLLPLIGATELDDWPGGIRQQFKAAAPMLEQMLLALKKEKGLEGPLAPEILDDGDAVGAWSSPNLAAVLFPTADTLKQIRSYADARSDGLTLLANPQWSNVGQIVADFGWGPFRKANEDLVATFTEVYCFRQLRILGEEVRILYAYPGQWQVHVLEDDGSLPLVWSGEGGYPGYTELEALLRARPGSKAAMGPIARMQAEIKFNMKQ